MSEVEKFTRDTGVFAPLYYTQTFATVVPSAMINIIFFIVSVP